MANGYKKIGGGGRSGRLAVTQDSLWRGADHLLVVERDSYNETYKRFYFSDIESISIRRTKRQMHYMIIFSIILALLTWVALVTTGFERGFTIFWIIFFLVPFLYNLFRGPTCVTQITTAVQKEELPALRRVRKAERILAEIIAEAQAAQGLLTPDMAKIRLELQNAPAGAVPPPIPVVAPPPLAVPPPPAPVPPTSSPPPPPLP